MWFVTMSTLDNYNVCISSESESTHGSYPMWLVTMSTHGNYYIDADEYTACGGFHVNTVTTTVSVSTTCGFYHINMWL